MLHLVIVLTILANLAELSLLEAHNLGNRIVGGYPIDIKEVPYQVSITYGSIGKDKHICGGALISKYYVLTSAHCIYGGEAYSYKVRIGSSDKYDGGELIQVRRIIQHPKFNYEKKDYDFALLELAPYYDENIISGFIRLPQQNEYIKDGFMAIVTGWGNTMNSSEPDRHLRAVNVPIVNQKICHSNYLQHGGITDRMICAGYMDVGGKDACQEDAGGALVRKGILIGIVSWGGGCAEAKYPGVYGRVPAVTDWIHEIAKL